MTRYLRPLAILSGEAALAAVDEGSALALAGGPLAFALVETTGDGGRRILPAPDLRDALLLHVAPRPPVGTLTANPIVMGVVNATPDSFSDGGAHLDAAAAIAHGQRMIAAGATIVDVGGESTRPGASPVDPAEEIRRVVPVIAGLREGAERAGALISIDTRNAATMRAGLDAGARMINDVSALTHDPDSIAVVAASDVPVVLMHMQGDPCTMQNAPTYGDIVHDVFDYLAARVAACEAVGIARARIVADPGIGFGKTEAHNLALLDRIALFHGLGVNLMVGVSRKGFIGRLSGIEKAEQRLAGSLAAGLAALGQGARILRVHDVPETLQAVRVAGAICRT